MKLGDLWWLMKEIWPWTIGLPLIGAVLNLVLLRRAVAVLVSATMVSSVVASAAFMMNAGWDGGEFKAFGLIMEFLIVFLPALIAIAIGAAVSRMFTFLVIGRPVQ